MTDGWRDRLFVVQKAETKKYFLAEKPHVAEQRVSAHVAWCARRVAEGVSVWLVGCDAIDLQLIQWVG